MDIKVFLALFISIVLIGYATSKLIKSPNKAMSKYFILLGIFCLAFGYLENSWLSIHKTTGDKVILGHFSIYHLIMLIVFITASMFSLIAGKLDGWKNVPIMVMVEDIFFWFAKGSWIEEGDWIAWNFGGFFVWDFFVPYIYLTVLLLAVLLYSVKNIFKGFIDIMGDAIW